MSKASKIQIEMLLSFHEEHEQFSSGQFTTEFTARKRMDMWIELANSLNAQGPAVKSMEKWQKTWSDAKGAAKKKYNIKKKHSNGTGGGPPAKELTAVEERFVSLIGAEALDGLPVKESFPFSQLVSLPVEAEADDLGDMVEDHLPGSSQSVPSKKTKRTRNRGLIVPPEKTQLLIDSQMATAAALHAVADAISAGNDIKRQKLDMMRRQTEAIESFMNRF